MEFYASGALPPSTGSTNMLPKSESQFATHCKALLRCTMVGVLLIVYSLRAFGWQRQSKARLAVSPGRSLENLLEDDDKARPK